MDVLVYLFNTSWPWLFFYSLGIHGMLQKPWDHPCRRAGEDGFFVSPGKTTSHNMYIIEYYPRRKSVFICVQASDFQAPDHGPSSMAGVCRFSFDGTKTPSFL